MQLRRQGLAGENPDHGQAPGHSDDQAGQHDPAPADAPLRGHQGRQQDVEHQFHRQSPPHAVQRLRHRGGQVDPNQGVQEQVQAAVRRQQPVDEPRHEQQDAELQPERRIDAQEAPVPEAPHRESTQAPTLPLAGQQERGENEARTRRERRTAARLAIPKPEAGPGSSRVRDPIARWPIAAERLGRSAANGKATRPAPPAAGHEEQAGKACPPKRRGHRPRRHTVLRHRFRRASQGHPPTMLKSCCRST